MHVHKQTNSKRNNELCCNHINNFFKKIEKKEPSRITTFQRMHVPTKYILENIEQKKKNQVITRKAIRDAGFFFLLFLLLLFFCLVQQSNGRSLCAWCIMSATTFYIGNANRYCDSHVCYVTMKRNRHHCQLKRLAQIMFKCNVKCDDNINHIISTFRLYASQCNRN